MELPKIMEVAVRKMADIPADVPREQIWIDWDDNTYSASGWGCDTCGYGAPEDELIVNVNWLGNKGGYFTKSYTGYSRLSDFFAELESSSV